MRTSSLAVLLAALVAASSFTVSTGCSLAISGPDPKRSARSMPWCDTGKGLVALDTIFGFLFGVVAVTGLVEDEPKAAYVLLPSGLFLGAALHGSSKVDRCRAAYDEYVRELREEPTRVAKTPPDSSAPKIAAAASPPSQAARGDSSTKIPVVDVKMVSPIVAPAPPKPDVAIVAEARQHVRDAIAAQKERRFDDAIALYHRAFTLAPNPLLLFNLGQAHRLKGEKSTARDFYRKYLAADESGERSKEARMWAEKIDRELFRAESAKLGAAPE